MGLVFKAGAMGVDWEHRIDFDRLRRERLAKAKEALKNSDADVLFLLAPENVRYISGLRTYDMPQVHFGRAAAVFPKGSDPIIYTCDRDFAQNNMPWLKGRISDVSCEGIDTVEGARSWAQDAARWLSKLGVNPKKIGVDFWTPGLQKAVPETFKEAKFLPGQAIIMSARMIKTEDEIGCLKIAYDITAAGMQAAREFLRPGRKECEVQAVCFATMYALGSEWQQQAGIVSSDTAPYRRLATDKIIGHGEPLVMDVGGRFNGYMGDLTRTWICGIDARPPKELVKLHMRAYNAMKRAEAVVKPGATTLEVAEACGEENILSAVLGHGLGLGNEPPLLGSVPGEAVLTLKPGMVFSLEPYTGKVGVGGIRLEDNVIVTEDGCDVISTFPFEEKLME